MDFFKKGKDLLNKNKTGGSSSTTTTTAPTDKPAENKDYGDKGAEFLASKSGHKIDPKTTEKVTDGARGLYEKFSGKKVDPKYSN